MWFYYIIKTAVKHVLQGTELDDERDPHAVEKPKVEMSEDEIAAAAAAAADPSLGPTDPNDPCFSLLGEPSDGDVSADVLLKACN